MTEQHLSTAVVTIAGSDSCGGAGIQADLKTFAALGVYGASVVTAVTAQNTLGVQAVTSIPAAEVAAQLSCVLADLPVTAVKTGMLGSAETIRAVLETLGDAPSHLLVVDPVMVATSGATLADDNTVDAMRSLIRRAKLITPNVPELARLASCRVRNTEDMLKAGQRLVDMGAEAILLKGGHMPGEDVTDILMSADGSERSWTRQRLQGTYHGTGCTLSAAITAGLALGQNLEAATGAAIDYLDRVMRAGRLPRAGKLVLLRHDT